MTLTYFRADQILGSLIAAKKLTLECGTDEQLAEIDKSIMIIAKCIRDGLPMGEHEDYIVEQSEPDQTVWAMRKAYGGR